MGSMRCEGNVCHHRVTVWQKENYYSSKQAVDRAKREGRSLGITREVEITLPKGATAMCGDNVCVNDVQPWANLFTCPPFQADGVTRNPCFSHRQVYHELDTFIRFMSDRVGLDMHFLRYMRDRHSGPLPAAINIPNFNNAFYMPSDEDLSFGNAFASDGDIVLHETGHWVIDMINKKLADTFLGAGLAIHEGCADAIAALIHGDAQIAEDIGYFKGRNRGTARGLRTCNNTTTFRDIFSVKKPNIDSHHIGTVYSGFWWKLMGRIEGLIEKRTGRCSPENRVMARIAVLKMVVAHADSYIVPTPSFADFKPAVVKGTQGLFAAGELDELAQLGIGQNDIVREIEAEAKVREFDWMEQFMGAPKAQPTTLAGMQFTKPVILGADPRVVKGEGRVRVAEQLYVTKTKSRKTRKPYTLPVLGHGKLIDRKGVVHTEGVLPIAQGSFDETVRLTKEKAFAKAMHAVTSNIEEDLKRREDAPVEANTIHSLVATCKKSLMKLGAKGAKLVVLSPKMLNAGRKDRAITKPMLAWYFKTDETAIAVEAGNPNGRILSAKVLQFID